MDVQGPRGLGIGMRVVAIGRGARRWGAGEWQERRLVRYGLGIRIAILIAISDTRISTARRHFRGATAQSAGPGGRGERPDETTEHLTSTAHSGYYGVGPTTHPVNVHRVHDILLVV
jgi:hypothetical protein